MRKDGSLRGLAQNIMFGGTAGVLGQLTIYPLYTAKTDLQNDPDLKRGMISRLRSIFRAGGFRGLYTGIIPTLSLTFPEKAIKLAMNDFFKSNLTDSEGKISAPKTMLAGGAAGLCQCAVSNPMELLRIVMQTRQRYGLSRLSTTELAVKLGPQNLYRDFHSTALRTVPFSAVFFTVHSTIMRTLTDRYGDISPGQVLISGFLSSTVASAFITPADLIKTRLMTDTGMLLLSKKEMQLVHEVQRAQNVELYNFGRVRSADGPMSRIVHSFREVYKSYGIRGSFRGVEARIMINAPLFGIATMSYELQKSLREKGII